MVRIAIPGPFMNLPQLGNCNVRPAPNYGCWRVGLRGKNCRVATNNFTLASQWFQPPALDKGARYLNLHGSQNNGSHAHHFG